jgi:hypothetical protein
MILPSKKILYSGTITGLRISSVAEKSFLDACAALVPYADGESDIYIYDSVGAFLKATLKAQGTGETFGGELLTNGNMEDGDPTPAIPTGWVARSANAELTSVDDERTDGAGTRCLNVKGLGSYPAAQEAPDPLPSAGALLYLSFYGKDISGGVGYAACIMDINTNIRILSSSWINRTAYASVSGTFSYVGLYGGTSAGHESRFDDVSFKQVLTPSTDGVTLQASKLDTTESFGVKAAGFKYNEASYAVRVFKAR